MRMRRKKHLDTRLEQVSDGVINMHVSDRRFDAGGAEERLDPTALFGNGNPVRLEIGCGKGGFICEMAKRHPQINFLAVELYGNVLVTACEEAQRQGLTNVRFLWGNAEYLPRFLPPHSMECLYLNFSTPFPKKRYASHRLTHRHFLDIYRGLLTPDAHVIQKTDNPGLFAFSIEEFSQSGYVLREVSLDWHAEERPDDVITEYERKFMEQGLPIYRLDACVRGE